MQGLETGWNANLAEHFYPASHRARIILIFWENAWLFRLYCNTICFFQTKDFSRILQQYNILDDEYEQNRYLATFDLQRNPIVGDGNCLFRAISFSLFGHQDNHLQLRNMAVETLRGNIDMLRDYFIDALVLQKNNLTILVNQVLMQNRNAFLH